MDALQDKVTLWVPDSDKPVLEALIAIADIAFGSCTTVEANDGKMTLLTVFAPRIRRAEFMKFVLNSVTAIGTALSQDSVLAEVNGIGGIYRKGVDYE